MRETPTPGMGVWQRCLLPSHRGAGHPVPQGGVPEWPKGADWKSVGAGNCARGFKSHRRRHTYGASRACTPSGSARSSLIHREIVV